MKLASILPMCVAPHTFDGDYAMMLTHLASNYKSDNNRCYRILDNSLIELGKAVTLQLLLDAAEETNAHEIILPDEFRDGPVTLGRVKNTIGQLKRKKAIGQYRLMAVCHGATLAEFEKTFHALEAIPEVHCIGIPKVASTLSQYGRPGLEYIWQGSCKNIHLLGCATSLSELREYTDPAAIRSCDTCIPFILARDGCNNAWANRPDRSIDFYGDKFDDRTLHNYLEIIDQLKQEGLV